MTGYLNCRYFAALDRAVAVGAPAKPKSWDPLLDILRERGASHEKNHVEHLAKAGLEALKIDGIEITDAAVSETLAAMKAGVPVIVQAGLARDGWVIRDGNKSANRQQTAPGRSAFVLTPERG